MDRWAGGELGEEVVGGVGGVILRGRGAQAAEIGAGGEAADVAGPGVVVSGDEGVDAVGVLKELAGGRGELLGVAVEVVPAEFDVGGLDAEEFLGQGAFLGMGDVEDAALRVDAGESQGQGRGEEEVAEGAEVEEEDVAAKIHRDNRIDEE